MKQATQSKTIGWIGSITFHVAILCLIAYYAYFVTFTITGDVRVEGTREPVPQDLKAMVSPADDGSLLAGTDRRLAEQLSTREGTRQALEKAHEASEKMSSAEKMQTIEAQSPRLESIRSQSLANILSHVEASAGIVPEKKPLPQYEADIAADKARAGSQPQQARQFDFETSELTDVLKVKTSHGKVVYLWTMTDASGLKESFEVPEADMDAEQLRIAELFERAQKHPNFNQVFRTALKLASKRAREEAAAKPRD